RVYWVSYFSGQEGDFMFIETYYDDRTPVPGSTSEPIIPYPELSGEQLTVWRNYLPMRREIRNLYSPFNAIPDLAIEEIKRQNVHLTVSRSGPAQVIPWRSDSSKEKIRATSLSHAGEMRNSR